MRLNQDLINELEKSYVRLEDTLEREGADCPSSQKKLTIQESLDRVRDRRAALAGIVTRNMARLPDVTRKVFVSTHFEHGDLPRWLRDVFNAVNASRTLGHFEPVIGKAKDGGDFLLAILEKMIGCHYFLCVVTADAAPSGWPIPPYLVEEIGAAFPLPIPVLIAIERGCTIDPDEVGRLFGTQWQRLPLDKEDIPRSALVLGNALRVAHEMQQKRIADTRRALIRFFQ